MKKTNGFLIAAAIILGLAAVYWLIQGFGLMFNGVSLGTYGFYIVIALFMIALIFFSRSRALLVGIVLSALAIMLAVYFLMFKLNIYDAAPFLLLMCIPMGLSGLLFIEADWSTKRNKA